MNQFLVAVLLLAVPGNCQCGRISGRNTAKRGISNLGYGTDDKTVFPSGGFSGGFSGQTNQDVQGYNEYNGKGFYVAAGPEVGDKFNGAVNGGYSVGYENGGGYGGNGVDAEINKEVPSTGFHPSNAQNYFAASQTSQQPVQFSAQQPDQFSAQPSFTPAYRSFPVNMPHQLSQGMPSGVYPGVLPQPYKSDQGLNLPVSQGLGSFNGAENLFGLVGAGHEIGGSFTNGIKGGAPSGYKSNLSGGGFGGFGVSDTFSGGHGFGRGFTRGYRSLSANQGQPYYSQGPNTYTRMSLIPTH